MLWVGGEEVGGLRIEDGGRGRIISDPQKKFDVGNPFA